MLDPRHKQLGSLISENRLLASAKLLQLAAEVPFSDVATTVDELSHIMPSRDEDRRIETSDEQL